MKKNPNVIVIGGGVVGVCSAYYLHQAGCRVTLFEQGEICDGCSYGNAGLIVPSHSVPLAEPGMVAKGIKWMFDPESPFYIKPRLDKDLIAWLWKFWLSSTAGHVRKSIPLIRDLSMASLSLFEELAEIEDLEFGYQEKGMVQAFNTEEGFENGRKEAGLLEPYGIESVIMNAEDIRTMLSGMRTSILGGICYTQDAHITPQRFVRELARHIENQGVDIRPSTEVLGFDTNRGTLTTVKTTRGDFSADEIVVTAGSWSHGVGNMLGLSLPIQPAKGYSITVKRLEDWPEAPMVLAESKVAVTPMMETLRFGGTLELAGFDFSINRRRVEAILKALPKYLPDLNIDDFEVLEVWRGWRPCTPDGLPFLGRPQAYENLVVAAGHAMVGISLGPITGRLVSQIVAGEETDIDIAAMRVERFG